MKLTLSSVPYSILIRWAILALGIFGVILPALVDMFPHARWTSVLYLKELDAGFAELSSFDTTINFADTGTEEIGSVLYQHEKGYDAIYNLLRTIDPELPSLQDIKINSSTPGEGVIFVYDGAKWDNTGGAIPLFRPVQLSLKETGVIPICELNDLPPLIRDYKVRFWTRVGSALALLALVIPFIPLTKFSTLSQKPANSINLADSEANQSNVNIAENYENVDGAISLLQIVSVMFIILGITLLVKSRK